MRLTPLRLAGFVSPEAPLSTFLIPLVVFIPPFYAGELGLGLSVVGAVFAATKIFDVVSDPILGSVTDRMQTRFGRRRPWFVVSVPLMLLCTYKIFMPNAPVSAGYFAFWMILLYVGWTLVTISHLSWAAELSTDYHERSRIAGYKQAAGLVGGLLAISIPVVVDRTSGGAALAAERLWALGAFVMVALPLTATAALSSASEPPTKTPTTAPARPNGWIGTLSLFSKGPLRTLLFVNLTIGMASSATGGLLVFYVDRVLDLGSYSTMAMLPFFLSGLAFLPLWVALSRRIGKHRTLGAALIYQMLMSPLLLWVPANSLGASLLVFLLLGASFAVGTFIPQALMADVSDLETARSGSERTGLHMALLQSSSKVAAALSMGVTYPLLSAIGFDPAPEATNPSETLFGLRILMTALPAGLALVALLAIRNFPLDEDKQVEIRRQIDAA